MRRAGQQVIYSVERAAHQVRRKKVIIRKARAQRKRLDLGGKGVRRFLKLANTVEKSANPVGIDCMEAKRIEVDLVRTKTRLQLDLLVEILEQRQKPD
jgi:hypothetical protein